MLFVLEVLTVYLERDQQSPDNKVIKLDREEGIMRYPGGSVVKNPAANVGASGDMGLIPGSGRSPGGGNGKPPQYSCLENPMDRGYWQAAAQGVAKSWTRLNG